MKKSAIDWQFANDIHKGLSLLVETLGFSHVNMKYIRAFRSFGSKSRARARIWSFPKIWQLALDLPPYYVIEVLSEKFDHLSSDDKAKVLIHELMHIPKNFSGALVPHRGRFHRIDHRTVDKLFNMYKKNVI